MNIYAQPDEIWKYIPGYGHKYMISSMGRIYNADRDIILKTDSNNGVSLSYNNETKGWTVHVLMGCTFLGNDINDPYRNRVLFKDKDKNNLKLDNLYIEDTSDLDGEEWRRIHFANNKELTDIYSVSNLGRVKSIKHETTWMNYGEPCTKCVPEMILSLTVGIDGYKTLWMSTKEKPDITAQVHRLVAAAFCENDDPEHKTVVNHIDGNPSNNSASNLEWCTPAENAQHAIDTGLKGDWKGRKLRYPVLRIETNSLYNSMSDVDKAMGRKPGYCNERITHGEICTDADGNVWTLKVLNDLYLKVNTEGQHCTIDEFPGKNFISLSEASVAIGRWEGYISEALKQGGVIRNKAGRAVHVRLTGDAPCIGANEVRMQKKAAGLVPEKKTRKQSEWAPKKAVKCIETGEVFASMSAADRAMGRKVGTLNECFSFDRLFKDKDGNVRTFEFVDEDIKIDNSYYSRNQCYLDEYPVKRFSSLEDVSKEIGRGAGYVADRVSSGKPIIHSDGYEVHLHFVDQHKEFDYQDRILKVSKQDLLPKQRITKFACRFDEVPDQVFSNFSKAAEFLNKGSSFVRDRFVNGDQIIVDGKEYHLHMLDENKEREYQEKLLVGNIEKK